jgi:hypothetical protein
MIAFALPLETVMSFCPRGIPLQMPQVNLVVAVAIQIKLGNG